MSTSPAYHLRTNKAVERLLFVELLHRLDRALRPPIARRRYVGLGGPYLDDFAMIHATFGNPRMVSLETHEYIRTRQVINRPHSQVDVTLDSTEDYVDRYVASWPPTIVWFDYEWPDWKNQLAESCDLLRKLAPTSIFKITLSGKTDELGAKEEKDPLAARATALSEMFADYGPFEAKDLHSSTICRTLYQICRRTVADAVPDTDRRRVRPLASYEYNDGTPILTVTMTVGPVDKVQALIDKAELQHWPFRDLDWRGPLKIAVPSLSLREKLAVDQLLPQAAARTVLRKLKLRFTSSYKESEQLMKNYVQFYRQVPQFVRITP